MTQPNQFAPGKPATLTKSSAGSGDPAPPAAGPRARLGDILFGWAFAPRAGLATLIFLAALGAALVAAEYVRPRAGLRLPFEDQAGFYAAVGGGAVAGVLLVAAALRWLLVREHPYPEDLFEPEARDDDHA
jgi:hypothetical protein